MYKHQRYKLWPEPLLIGTLPAFTMTSSSQDQFSDDAQHVPTVHPSKGTSPFLELPGGKTAYIDG